MRPLIRALTLSVALLCSAPLFAEELSASAVKAFSARMEAATVRRDVETLLGSIADDAVISSIVHVQGQSQTVRMNKSQYRQMLKITFDGVSSYSSKRSNEKISIVGTQAVVTADVVETMVVSGQQLTTRAHERVTVQVINGKLMATGISSTEAP